MSGQNKKTDQNYIELISAIQHGGCAIFIGAGISIPIGYPSLQTLLNDMAMEANIIELQNKKITNDWKKDFQAIKEALGEEKYYEWLLNKFNPKTDKHEYYHKAHSQILTIPFSAYVTINYDPCLEYASTDLIPPKSIEVISYPNFLGSKLRGGHIFHPHGYINPENPKSVKSIILSKDEYDIAYSPSGECTKFFSQFFAELDVVFIGFGWKDKQLIEIIKNVKSNWQLKNDFYSSRGLPVARERQMYAIIDNETFMEDQDLDNNIGELGVLPIPYEKLGHSHINLIDMLKDIQKQTTDKVFSPMPTTPQDMF